MRVAYFDCFSGIAGNMVLGALVDLGVAPDEILAPVEKLGVHEFGFESEKVRRGAIGGTHVRIVPREDKAHGHRAWRDLRVLIGDAPIDARVKEMSLDVFGRLAEAEARVHRVDAESVTFHEVGAVDAIVDVVGSCAGLHALGVARIHCSPLPLGPGSVATQHGELPLPAPATLELLSGMSVRAASDPVETVTPTGAAIVSALAAGTGGLPAMRIAGIGYGAGDDRATRLPNLLRVVLGETDGAFDADSVCVIETNIDDLNPEIYAYLSDHLSHAGALDVSLTPVQMKKGRPGTLLRVIGRESDHARLAEVIFRESSAIGLRVTRAERLLLRRRMITVETPYGQIRVKVAGDHERVRTLHPEFEDCRRRAEAAGAPLKDVMAAALAAAREKPAGP